MSRTHMRLSTTPVEGEGEGEQPDPETTQPVTITE